MKKGMEVDIRLKDGSWWNAKAVRRTTKANSKKYPEHWMVRGANDIEIEIDFKNIDWRPAQESSEAFHTIIPREFHERSECRTAKEKELKLLEEFEVYEPVSEEDVGNNEILPCTLVITEKETKGTKTTKAGLCVMGNKKKWTI